MDLDNLLTQRSESKCELCASASTLQVYNVPSVSEASAENSALICDVCLGQINEVDSMDAHHWHCLNNSMWTQVPAIQVIAWRMLKRLSSEGWAQDLLDMLYLDEETRQWAETVSSGNDDSSSEPTLDSNGSVLLAGDTVTLIKDLDVKGGGFTAKRGTAVRNISLTSNPGHIEGRVNGVRIVILTKFLKKSN